MVGFLHTGAGAHGLYPSRNDRFMYVSNREAGSISVVSFKTRARDQDVAAAACRRAPTWAACPPTAARCG